MWLKITTWFLSNFSWVKPLLKETKEWFTPSKLFIIGVCLMAGLIMFFAYTQYLHVKKKEENTLKEIALLEIENIKLEAKNRELLKTLEKVNKEHNASFSAIEKLHKKRLKREVNHARQQERNKHSKDGNLEPVLIDTFDWLRSQEANSSRN